MSRMPTLFVSHGAPDLALRETPYTRALGDFGRRFKPRAILIVSAHWEDRAPVRVGAARRPATLHDFSGFPRALSEIAYRPPGDPDLAAQAAHRLETAGIPAILDPVRGLDHGAWVPLRFLSPSADGPVVGVSLPRPRDPSVMVAMGRALSTFAEDGILLLGSGGVVHNLGRLRFGEPDAPVEPWAREFEEWVIRRLESRDEAGLLAYRLRAPHAGLAVPTPEHFDPLLFAFGASSDDDNLVTLHSGFELGSLSLRAFAFDAKGDGRKASPASGTAS